MNRFISQTVCKVLGLFMVALPVATLADGANLYGAFCGAKNEMRLLKPTPVTALEDAELFLAADAIRTRHMSAEQRMFNYYWIQQEEHNTSIGSRAVSKILRLGAFKFWRTQGFELNNAWAQPDAIDDLGLELRAFSLGEGNYSVKASSSQLSVHFELIF